MLIAFFDCNIVEIAIKYRVDRVALFGSYTRGEARPDKKNRTAKQIAKNKRADIEDSLFSHLFKGDEFLDDGIIRVLSFSGIWGMERLFELVFTDDSIKLTRWNIAAIAKHCSDRLPTSWDIVVEWINKMKPLEIDDNILTAAFITTESSIENMGFIIPRYFYKVCKLSKSRLIKTIKVETIQRLYDNSQLIAMFPCKAYDEYGYFDARTEIKYALETIIHKIIYPDRLFIWHPFIERMLGRLLSKEDCILTPTGRYIMLDKITQLSEEYYKIKYQKDFDIWLDRCSLVFYDIVISNKINEYVVSDGWIREILSICRPVSDACISKALEIINSEALINSEKAEFNIRSYVFDTFNKLIGIMNLKAIDILYDYIINKRIAPNQNIASYFIFGIDNVYFAGKGYTYQYTKMCESIGHKWELTCRTISKYLYGDKTIVHTKLENGNIPDIAVQDEWYPPEKYPLLIECKRSYNDDDIEACQLKYVDYCDKLEIWVFASKLDEPRRFSFCDIDPLFREKRDSYLKSINANAKTRVLFIEDILDKIRENTFLVNEMNRLWNENKEITYAYVIKNQIEQKCKDKDLKGKIIVLLEMLLPYLN